MHEALQSTGTEAFRSDVYSFFRVADDPELLPDRTLGPEDYYRFRRSILKRLALGGTYVRSIGEKWIADFLFEHGIFYDYEEYNSWDGQPYRPDFTLKDVDKNFGVTAILEHWGVSAQDADDDEFLGNMTAGQYRS